MPSVSPAHLPGAYWPAHRRGDEQGGAMSFVVKAFVASVVIPIVVLFLVRYTILAAEWPAGVAESYNGVLENYCLTIGTIYAVLLAFIVFVVWNRYNEAQAAVEHEANSVQDLYRLSQALTEPARGELATAIEDYLAKVTEIGWSTMARGQSLQSVDMLLDHM
jgi:large-conductance mechanosensitive channel